MNEDFTGFGLEPADRAWLQEWFSSLEDPLGLTLECQAYIATHYANFLVFAQTILEDGERSRAVALSVLTEIAADWSSFTRQVPDTAAAGFELLVQAVVVEAHLMGLELPFDKQARLARQLLDDMRQSLQGPEADTDVGLYRTLRLLMPRQFDILILKAAGRSTLFVAWFLQTAPSTVDRNYHRAKAYIGGEMQLRRLVKPDLPARSPGARRRTGVTS
ncbi:hypothetical protein [Streptacidiphilus sp. PAMC 29251]